MKFFKYFYIFFFICFSSNLVYASDSKNQEDNSVVVAKDGVISLTPVQIINLSKKFIEDRNFHDAKMLLLKTSFNVLELEIERLHLLAQIAILEDNIDTAIDIYRFILDYQPNISSIRFKLAQLYMLKKSWYKADYHFRLAATDKGLPDEVKMEIAKALFITRQNKNWNVWFNIGAAPDNNINNAQSGEQCIATIFGVLCNQLPYPEKAIGFNTSFGGNYEFILNDNWRIRNELVVSNSMYDKNEYDDLYIGYNIGPKYVFRKGEVASYLTTYRRWLDHSPYSYSVGVRVDANYDLTNRLSVGAGLRFSPTFYDDYGDYLDGNVSGIDSRLVYSFDASKYIIFRNYYEMEKTEDPIYSNNRFFLSLGFGIELPYGFFVYLEPSILFTNYKEERPFIKDLSFENIKEEDITRKYMISFSNRKIKFWGFTPTFSYTYTNKSSNVWQREYKKSAFEFTINQRF